MTLEDLIPVINPILEKHKVTQITTFEEFKVTLKLINSEKPEEELKEAIEKLRQKKLGE